MVMSPRSWCRVPQVLGLLVVMSLFPLGLQSALQARSSLSYPFSPPSWVRPCWVLAPMWWPVVTPVLPVLPPVWSPRGWRWLLPWHHHQVPVLAPCSWDSQDMALLGAWRPVRSHQCAGFVSKV